MPPGRRWRAAWFATLALTWPIGTFAIVLDDPANFAVKRTFAAADLGIPANLGGLLFSADGATLYAVGASESNASAVWAVPVTRDAATDEVTALGPMAAVTKVFDGDASVPGSGIAAGLGFGPAGTFFYVYWDANQLAQRPGGVGGAETQYAMAPLGVPRATTGLTFSPHVTDPATGFGLLQVSANVPELYNVSLTDAGAGLYPPDAVELFARMPRGEIGGLDYVPMGVFAGDFMYVSWNAGSVYVVDVDPATGLVIDAGTSMPTLGTTNPTEQRFASDLGQGPWGLEFDPLTGDLFVGTWNGDPTNTIFQIGGPGFAGPTTTTTTLPGDAKLLPGQKLLV